MSEKTNDGGPAFPFDWKDFQPHSGEQVVREQFSGMSLRDYFAAKAMAGMLAEDADAYTFTDLAAASYRAADAMLAERAK